VDYGHHLSDLKEFLPTPGQGEEASVGRRVTTAA
jgi:hypothetical protein